MKRLIVTVALALVAISCQDIPGPERTLDEPQFDIRDGANDGNEHFFFLPPLVPAPTYDGTFDITPSPSVDICELDGAACGNAIANFTMTTGPGSETVRRSELDELYIVNWHTDEFGLATGQVYRILVSAYDIPLGYADVEIASSGKEAKNLKTGDTFGLKDGRTLPIKFRVEEGALSPACTAPPSGLVNWWTGDGDANDIVGNNDGTLVGDATFATGMVGQGFIFDGAGDYVEIQNSANLNLPQLTVDAWIFIDPAQLATKYHSIVGKFNGSNSGGGFYLGYDTRNDPANPVTQNALLFGVAQGPGHASSAHITQALPSAKFYHVAGTFDGSVARLFLDGVLVATGAPITSPGFNVLPVRIGAMHYLEVYGGDDRFQGIIDEVELFDRAISATEIQAIYAAGSAGKCKS